MSNLKISIIIPVYNVEKYLAQCLNSILNQTYTDFEVILIDDGSQDNSGTICDEFAIKDSRIHVIHQMNAGVSVARNNGVKLTTGEWITFIDPDDWVDTNFLEYFNLSEECELSIQGLRYLKTPEQSLIEVRGFEDRELFLFKDFKDLASTNLLLYGTVCCKVYNKKILNRYHIRFDESISYHEDHIFFLKYLQHINHVSLHKEVGYNYRIISAGTSLSSKVHSWNMLNDSSNIIIKELLNLPFFKCLPSWYQRQMTTYCMRPKINACRAIFDTNIDNDLNKVEAFNIITQDKAMIRQYYHPDRLISRLQKKCLLKGYWATQLFFYVQSLKHIFQK